MLPGRRRGGGVLRPQCGRRGVCRGSLRRPRRGHGGRRHRHHAGAGVGGAGGSATGRHRHRGAERQRAGRRRRPGDLAACFRHRHARHGRHGAGRVAGTARIGRRRDRLDFQRIGARGGPVCRAVRRAQGGADALRQNAVGAAGAGWHPRQHDRTRQCVFCRRRLGRYRTGPAGPVCQMPGGQPDGAHGDSRRSGPRHRLFGQRRRQFHDRRLPACWSTAA